ncbi:MAG: hypothetical protein KAR20_20420, partial [Candidatus Heimdallarchaeota archaeon]|nr:hypothetical protein [Candidatus Heimdallarchaeota archaeon]
ILAQKSIQGTFGMLIGSFLSLFIGFYFFSTIYPLSFLGTIMPILFVTILSTLIELISPKGLDNLTIPLCCSLSLFLLTGGGIY